MTFRNKIADALRAISVIAGFAILIIPFATFIAGHEREGTVKYDDCREVVTIDHKSWHRYLNDFTCAYQRTINGKVMAGECVHVETTFLGAGCRIAYVYQKQPQLKCPPHSTLTVDDKCTCE